MSSTGVRVALLRAAGLRATSRSLLRTTARAQPCAVHRELWSRQDAGKVPSLVPHAAGTQWGELTARSGRALCLQAGAPRVHDAGEVPADGSPVQAGAKGEKEHDAVDNNVVGGAAGDAVGDAVDVAANEAAEALEEQSRSLETKKNRDVELEPKRRWLRERLGLTEQRAHAIAENSGWMLSRSVDDDFEPKLQWLQQRVGLRTEREAAQLVAENLLLLRLDTDDIESSMEALRKVVKVNDTTMAKMVVTCPRILVVSVSEVSRRMKWLEERLVLSESNANRVVINRPMLLVMSIESRLEPTVAWAERELRLDPQQIGILTLKYPKWMFAITRSGLDLRLRWLQTALGCTKEQAARMMSRDGRLWFLGRKNLWPKIVFFREDLGVPQSSLRDAVVKCPMIIASNLKTRIRPRVVRMSEAGIAFDFEEHQRVISLASDESFEKWFAEAREVQSTTETSA